MSHQVTFQIGPGILFCVPITLTDYLSNGICMLKLNTCETYSAINSVDNGIYSKQINIMMQNFKENHEIECLLNNLKPVVNKLIKYIEKNSILKTIQKTSEDCKCFVMNFVGKDDDDQISINKIKDFQLINLFLKETNKSAPYTNESLPVLIDNGGILSADREMSIQEFMITTSLVSYFQKNNCPYALKDDENKVDYYIFQKEDINDLASSDRSKRFSIVHYIQSLFTSVMILYIDESPQTREKIFDNFENLINELVIESPWLNERQNNEAVSFLIEKIFFNAHLIQEIDFDSIKKLSIEIYQSLEFSNHVTQIEFIKLPKDEKRLANGFMINNGNFYLPLLSLLTTFKKELELDLDDPIFHFLRKIEKHCSQILAKNLLLTNYINEISKYDWENALKDFDNMNIQEQTKFIEKYDQEIQDLLFGISAKSFNEINCLSNQSFQNVLPDNLSIFNEDEQFQLFFANEKNRFKFISSKQLKIIKPKTFSLLNDAVKQNKISRQNLNDFIKINGINFSIEQLLLIDFDLLEVQNQTIFLIKIINGSPKQIQQLDLSKCHSEILQIIIEKRLNDLSPSQTNSLDLMKLYKRSHRIYVIKNFDKIKKKQFLTINFLYFNDEERISFVEKRFAWVTTNQFLTLNYPKLQKEKPKLYEDIKQNLLEIAKNHDLMIFYLYLFHSQKFEINESVIQKMTNGFKTIYFNNHANTIQKEYQHLFFDSIKTVFETPNLYRDELFSIIISHWEIELIRKLINYIDFGEFPTNYLYDFINLYQNDIQPQKFNEFKINDLYQITDTEKRFFIFQYFINKFISFEKIDLIRKIRTRNLNKQETEFLLKKALKYLVPDQVIQIDVTQISHSLLIELLNEKIDSITQIQIHSLDANDSESMKIIIKSGKSIFLRIDQIRSLILQELNSEKDDLIKKLINQKIDKKFIFEYLTDDQIKFIDFDSVYVKNHKDFIMIKGNLLEKRQINQIHFKKGKKSVDIDFNIQLIQHLDKCNKLNFLNEEQVQNLVEIFDSNKFNKILNIFKSTEFASFYTNKQATQINEQIIQALDLNNLEPHFLVYLLRFKIELFLPKQIVKVDLSKYDKDLLNIWFENLSKLKISQDEWYKIIEEKVSHIPIQKLNEIVMHKLSIDILKIIIDTRIDDLLESQIQDIDTSNKVIDSELIKRKFKVLKNEQKFDIPLSQLNAEDQASFLWQLIRQDAFLIKSINKKEIRKINLTKLMKYPEGFFSLLISADLSKNQYMTIDWMMKDEHDRMNIALIYFFHNKLILEKNENYQYLKRILISHLDEKVDEHIFDKSPVEYKVSFLNTKILNNEAIDENLQKFFIPDAIKIIFKKSKYFIKTVQFIINEWIHLNESISKFIDILSIQDEFTEETIQNILGEKYLLHLKSNQIQKINLSIVQSPVVEYSLKYRAGDFLNSQIQNSKCIDKEIICDQLNNIRDDNKIPSLNLTELHIILIHFLFNQKFHLLKYNKINDLLIKRVNELDVSHFKQINIAKIGPESLNHVIHERIIDITETAFDQLHSNNLNKLKTDNLLSLLIKFQNKLTKELVKDLNVSNSRIAAFFLINCVNLLTQNHIRSMNLIEVSLITQQQNGKSAFDILKEKKLYKYLSEFQLNQLEFADINNVKIVLENKREDEINEENCKKIDLIKVNELSEDLKTNLIKSRILFFNEAQIQDLNVSIKNIIKIIIENNLTNILLINQVQQIKVNELENDLLAELIIQKLFCFSKNQMNEQNVKNVLKNQNDNDVISTLGEKQKIELFQSYHIQSLKLTSVNVISLLIIYHCQNLSTEQIQSIPIDQWKDIANKIEENSNKSALFYFIKANKFNAFLNEQFNAFINYNDLLCIKEILYEKLEKKITKENAEKIKLLDAYHNLSNSEFLQLFEGCYLMFSAEQIQSLNLSFLKNKVGLLTSFIINKLSNLNQNQMKETYIIDLIKSLSSDNILKMLNDKNNKKFVKFYHICNININSNIEVTKTIVGYYPNILTENNIKSLTLDLNLQIQDIDGNRKKVLDILISANKLVYFNDSQLNSIDYSNSQYVIEVLKYESLFDKISSKNTEKININEVSNILKNKQCLWNLLSKKIKNFSDKKLSILNTEHSMIAKIIRENKITCRLNHDQKFKFLINELVLCDHEELSNFFIPGNGGSFDVAIGIMLYKCFKGEYNDEVKNQIKNWLEKYESKDHKFNEIYFAKCILLVKQKLIDSPFKFEDISTEFFRFFNDLGSRIKFDIIYHMTCRRFTNECIQFKITPIDLKNIIKYKYNCFQDKSSFKRALSKITSPFVFNSNMSSEYQNELKILLKDITNV